MINVDKPELFIPTHGKHWKDDGPRENSGLLLPWQVLGEQILTLQKKQEKHVLVAQPLWLAHENTMKLVDERFPEQKSWVKRIGHRR